jgi:hypothetical protein
MSKSNAEIRELLDKLMQSSSKVLKALDDGAEMYREMKAIDEAIDELSEAFDDSEVP